MCSIHAGSFTSSKAKGASSSVKWRSVSRGVSRTFLGSGTCGRIAHVPAKRATSARTVFLLSPANSGGRRAQLLVRPEAEFPLAVRLREGGAPLGEVFQFMSGLYFRGKLAYGEAFSSRSGEEHGA